MDIYAKYRRDGWILFFFLDFTYDKSDKSGESLLQIVKFIKGTVRKNIFNKIGTKSIMQIWVVPLFHCAELAIASSKMETNETEQKQRSRSVKHNSRINIQDMILLHVQTQRSFYKSKGIYNRVNKTSLFVLCTHLIDQKKHLTRSNSTIYNKNHGYYYSHRYSCSKITHHACDLF